ncbi:GNAT family N-acetyltransferase [Nocardiopsis valliformis]|uniref:GNAT family N-acetyltransferase n=1 Tax=Nocardiopsis valliformis TaxID=239974 RepID=UPI001955315D|nr:GNAT family N-acetyltransferase [Nocardiopsis valliformis]
MDESRSTPGSKEIEFPALDAVTSGAEESAGVRSSVEVGADDFLSADERRELDEAMRLVYRAGASQGVMAEKQATIETARLRLEPLEPVHADAVVGLFTDPVMSTYLGTDLSQGGLARTMVDNRLTYEGPPQLGHWAIIRGDQVVGLAHLRPSKELPGGLPEIGWYLGASYGGAGLATEAAWALLRHGLDGLRLASVWALVHVDNAPSLNLAARLGFLQVGKGHHYNGPHRVHVALPGTASTC